MANTVLVRGSGGATFEVDPDNEVIAAQIARKDLIVIAPPEAADRIAEGVKALVEGSPTDAAEWLAAAKPAEVTAVLAQTGDAALDFANALLGFEQGGKHRKTMVAALEAYLEEATEPPSEGEAEIRAQEA